MKLNPNALIGLLLVTILSSCGGPPPLPQDPMGELGSAEEYQIGPLDQIKVFVWRAEDLSVEVPVRPDGRISLPLVGELRAAGKTPLELTDDVTDKLRAYVQNPVVSIIVTSFGDTGGQTVRVVGEAGQATAIPYRAGMTVLDVMVSAGGLNEFAAGNDAVLIRGRGENEQVYGLKLDSLLNDGDVSVNAKVLPGDIILIPKSFF